MKTNLFALAAVIAAGTLFQSCSGTKEDAGGKPDSTDQAVKAPDRDTRSLGASRTYGDLYVKPAAIEAYATVQPWTSYWFPAKDSVLFKPQGDGPAPLQKYDQYVQQKYGQTTHAADWEAAQFAPDTAATWDGLCDPWSVASILIQPEPGSALLDGIQFNVVDMKALVVKTFQDMNGRLQRFGVKYTQEGLDDYQDIYPDQFHRVLMNELVAKRQAFVIDTDPGLQVWNAPVSGAQIEIVPDPDNAHIMKVSVSLQVSEYQSADGENVVGSDLFWLSPYTYDLYGNSTADGRFKVEYGIWTGKSYQYHPDYATVLPDPKSIADRKSFNPEIRTQIVEEILARSRQGH